MIYSLNASSICIGCGLCCDGTLHAKATVRPDDEATVLAAPLDILQEGERRFFQQPCPHFGAGACTIYACRPKVCRTYRCALLIAVEAGEISISDAKERVGEAKELALHVKRLDETATTPPRRSQLAERYRSELLRSRGPAREAAAKALLAIATLEHFLGRWFMKDSQDGHSAR